MLDICSIQSHVHNIWLFNLVFIGFLHPPSQPKILPNILDHVDHLPYTVLVLGCFIFQEESRKPFDWSKCNL